MTISIEKRFSPADPAEIEQEESGLVNISGYAAVFNERADIGGYWIETIAPGAFSSALEREDDVTFLINHEGLPLARTSSGTLRLSQDGHGLKMACQVDAEDPDVKRILPKMRRGDLNKMSFAFRIIRQDWDDSGDQELRTIHDVELMDVSIVTKPAFEGTEIGLRSRAIARQEQAAAQTARISMSLRLRLAEAGL